MRDNKPAISVVMPVFNGERFVAQAMDSILNQSFADWELIIVDDGSTDKTTEILASYLHDPRVQLYRNDKNRGYAATCNRGFALCQGRYIAIQDADDISEPQRLALQLQILDEHQYCKLVFSRALFIDEQGIVLHAWGGVGSTNALLEPTPYFAQLFINGNFIPNPSVMLRRDSDPVYSEALRLCNDFDFHLRLLHDSSFYYLAKPLVRIRRGRNHATMTSDRRENFDCERAILTDTYRRFQHDQHYPISVVMYRRALSVQYCKEARWGYRWRRPGWLAALAKALYYDPLNTRSYRLLGRAILPIYRRG